MWVLLSTPVAISSIKEALLMTIILCAIAAAFVLCGCLLVVRRARSRD